jgi:hypothetical protein
MTQQLVTVSIDRGLDSSGKPNTAPAGTTANVSCATVASSTKYRVRKRLSALSSQLSALSSQLSAKNKTGGSQLGPPVSLSGAES